MTTTPPPKLPTPPTSSADVLGATSSQPDPLEKLRAYRDTSHTRYNVSIGTDAPGEADGALGAACDMLTIAEAAIAPLVAERDRAADEARDANTLLSRIAEHAIGVPFGSGYDAEVLPERVGRLVAELREARAQAEADRATLANIIDLYRKAKGPAEWPEIAHRQDRLRAAIEAAEARLAGGAAPVAPAPADAKSVADKLHASFLQNGQFTLGQRKSKQ